ncbi:Ribonuclease H domain [Dillenia turbinata]|uniref:Ribonuclease H domain n=1 Tax=Dillenia turbinata TaxID=194707 RepID=A0AAN8Z828_9MAGN
MIKLNTNRVSNLITGKVDAGSIFRDSTREWIYSFIINIDKFKVDMVELWGINEDLRIVRDRNLKKFVVEMDSLQIVNMLIRGAKDYHPLKVLIQEYRAMLRVARSYNLITEDAERARFMRMGKGVNGDRCGS